jgi:hypothetical protein
MKKFIACSLLIFFFVGCYYDNNRGELISAWDGKVYWENKKAKKKKEEWNKEYYKELEDRRAEKARLREEKIKSNNWSPEIESDVINGYISIGMNERQVTASMGYPNGGKNYSVSAFGSSEQWVYRPDPMRDRYSTMYLYFKEGVLTSYDSY